MPLTALVDRNPGVDFGASRPARATSTFAAVTLEDGTQVTQDDGPRPGTIKEKLAELKPVFRPDGTVTAGNACPLNDGAAAGS